MVHLWYIFDFWKNKSASEVSLRPICRDSAGIQTRNLLIRSQMLYSVKLRNRTLSQTNKENWFSLYSFELTAKRNLFIFDVDSKESSKRKLTLSWRGEEDEVNLSLRDEVNLSFRKAEDEVNLSLKAVQRYAFISTIAHKAPSFFARNNVFISAEHHSKPQMPD